MTDKKHSDEHHLLPSSRGGPSEWWNLIKKVVKVHRCFHMLFRNLLPCEIVKQIKHWTNTKSGRVDKRKLVKRRGRKHKKIECWETLFGENARRKKAIRIIKEDWSVKDHATFRGCFGYKECFKHNNPGNPRKICPIIEMYKRGEIK